MNLDKARYSRAVVATLDAEERGKRLREIEAAANQALFGTNDLSAFQERLYRLIQDDLVKDLGYVLYSWDYNCEVETWGNDYMNQSLPSELVLESTYPNGIRLNWGECEFQSWT